MTQAELLRILETIPIGQSIPGMNPGTRYRFAGIAEYQSRGKAPDFDGEPMVTLESSRRRPPNIRLLVSVLATFMADGKAELGYGRTPRSVFLAYRRGYGPRPPNLYEYESHYKSLARYVSGLVT
jgi:hypothetical protein